jgi:hypothetical protein
MQTVCLHVHVNILLPFLIGFPNSSFPTGVPSKKCVSYFLHACYISRPNLKVERYSTMTPDLHRYCNYIIWQFADFIDLDIRSFETGNTQCHNNKPEFYIQNEIFTLCFDKYTRRWKISLINDLELGKLCIRRNLQAFYSTDCFWGIIEIFDLKFIQSLVKDQRWIHHTHFSTDFQYQIL